MRVVVVGAGPAGLAAARAAAGAGADVLLIDAAAKPGGQYHRQDSLSPADDQPLPPAVEFRANTAVWALEPPRRLHLLTGPADGPGRVRGTVDADALVLATGAHDRVLPFPGWDLPGVYSAGAAQALAKGQRVAVGSRVVVAGTGPFLLPVAQALLGVGARVAGVLEANRPRWSPGLLAGLGKTGELAGYLAVLACNRVPYRLRTAVIAAHGRDRVEAVTTARLDHQWRVRPGTERRVEVDAVCVGHGFVPQLELAAHCALRDGFVRVDLAQATSVPGVFAAGELTGIGGADLAACEGAVAGIAAARYIGAGPASNPTSNPAGAEPGRAGRGSADLPVPHRALRRVRRARRFADALARAYPVQPGWRDWLTDDTLVCRCEEVPYRDLRAASGHGVRALRLVSRAGLGRCQGRVCGPAVTALAGLPADAFARRPIATPIRLGELATPPHEERQ
ncbi:FAD-dependent oxidoreductase [Actinokineospora sp. 24-640]